MLKATLTGLNCIRNDMVKRPFSLHFLKLFDNLIFDLLLRSHGQSIHKMINIELRHFLMHKDNLQFPQFPLYLHIGSALDIEKYCTM